jgi:hypothetical protein
MSTLFSANAGNFFPQKLDTIFFVTTNSQKDHFVQNELTFPSVYVIKYQPYNAFSPGFCLESKKHGEREIVVSALRGQPGNTDFEAMSTKNYYILASVVSSTS